MKAAAPMCAAAFACSEYSLRRRANRLPAYGERVVIRMNAIGAEVDVIDVDLVCRSAGVNRLQAQIDAAAAKDVEIDAVDAVAGVEGKVDFVRANLAIGVVAFGPLQRHKAKLAISRDCAGVGLVDVVRVGSPQVQATAVVPEVIARR